MFDILTLPYHDAGSRTGFICQLSRVAKFVLCLVATITGTLTSTRYQQSPLVQGRLEALYIVIVEMLGPVNNNRTLGKYAEFVNIFHKDPVEYCFKAHS